MRDVIQMMKVIEGREGELVFKNINGKIFFIDRRYNSGYDNLEPGDTILVWVRKELDRTGYVSVEADNITIEQLTTVADKIKAEDILKAKYDNSDILHLVNHIIDKDSTYNIDLSGDGSRMDISQDHELYKVIMSENKKAVDIANVLVYLNSKYDKDDLATVLRRRVYNIID